MASAFTPSLRTPAASRSDPAWKAVAELLQLNHEKYDVYFQKVRNVLMHNHLSHHALTLYSLGGTAESIREHFVNHEDYQTEIRPANVQIIDALSDFASLQRHLGDPDKYADFLAYFTREMEKDGYERSVNRLLFSSDSYATEIFSRMVTGFIHPLIQTGFGIEFDLPILVLEGLAMACTQNDDDVASVMLEIEESASCRQDHLSFVDILDLCVADKELLAALKIDPFHVLDNQGLLGGPRQKVIGYTSRYAVLEHEVELRSAELCNGTSYVLAGAQRLGKEPKMDFFLLHATNCSILVDSIIHKDWISLQGKARLLSWFGRYSIMLYIAMGCPKLDLTPVLTYKPRGGFGGWKDVIDRSLTYKDDGHGCKIIRALIHAQQVTRHFGDRKEFRMKEMYFEKVATAVVDSWLPNDVVARAGHDQVEAWIRFAGFDEVWDHVPNIKQDVGQM